MAETITISEVKDFCPGAANFSDTTIQLWIDYVAQADTCLDANSVISAEQRLLKLNAICHFAMEQTGGRVQSQTDFEGASVTFSTSNNTGKGLAATTYGQFIINSRYRSCFGFMDTKSSRFLQTAGRTQS